MWLMQLYPSVTDIHLNIVDILIAIVYCSDQHVLVFPHSLCIMLVDSFLYQYMGSQNGVRGDFECADVPIS